MHRSDASRGRAACGAALLVTLAWAAPAAAYCRTSYCKGVGTRAICTPEMPSDCGIPLYWPSPCVSYAIQQDASREVSLHDTEGVFAEAFSTWTHADCGGGTPRIQVTYEGPVECRKHEYNQNAGNANIILYRDDGWPYAGSGSTLALTTVTYNLDTGEIYDADMELNSAQVRFSLSSHNVTFDLLSIATHETGHFLGLSHSPVPDATMYADYKPGTTSLRDLSSDDLAAICAVYPPGKPIDKSCDPTPRHGFSSLCGSEQQAKASGGCSAAAGDTGDTGGRGALLATAAGVAIAVLGRRARRDKAAQAKADGGAERSP